jgi:hypothetical protein
MHIEHDIGVCVLEAIILEESKSQSKTLKKANHLIEQLQKFCYDQIPALRNIIIE